MSDLYVAYDDKVVTVAHKFQDRTTILQLLYNEEQILISILITIDEEQYRIDFDKNKKSPTHYYNNVMLTQAHSKDIYYLLEGNLLYFYGVRLRGMMDENDGETYYWYDNVPYMYKDGETIKFLDNLTYYRFVLDAKPFMLVTDVPLIHKFRDVWYTYLKHLFDYDNLTIVQPYLQHAFGNIKRTFYSDNVMVETLRDVNNKPLMHSITRVVGNNTFIDYIVKDKVVCQSWITKDETFLYPLSNNVLNPTHYHITFDYYEPTSVVTPYNETYAITSNPSASTRLYGSEPDPSPNMLYYLNENAGIVPWDINNRMKIEDIQLVSQL